MVDQNETPIEKRFAPLLRDMLVAFAARVPPGSKPPLTHRPLVWLAWLALASCLGLAHLITPELRTAAIDAARRPGRRVKSPEGQASLFDLIHPEGDGLPGVYVSLRQLRAGNVHLSCGSSTLDLSHYPSPSSACAEAFEKGWGVIPAPNGLRFIPPTACMLIVHDSRLRSHPIIDELPNEPSSHSHEPMRLTDPLSVVHVAEQGNTTITVDDNSTANESSVAIVEAPPCNDKHNTITTQSFRSKARAQLLKNEDPDAPVDNRVTIARSSSKAGKTTRAKESTLPTPKKHATKKLVLKGRKS